MTVLFYILVSMGLVIIKTTLIPAVPVLFKCYDLLIPIIIYLGFYRGVRESLAIVVCFGLIMDSLSGGPLGLYLFAYLWLYGGVRWVSQYMHPGNAVLLAAAVSIGVAFEIVILVLYMAVLSPGAKVPEDAGETVVQQILWAAFTGPVIIHVIGKAQKRLDQYRSRILADR